MHSLAGNCLLCGSKGPPIIPLTHGGGFFTGEPLGVNLLNFHRSGLRAALELLFFGFRLRLLGPVVENEEGLFPAVEAA